MIKDIFDTKDISDLPDALQRELSLAKRDEFKENLITLFKKSNGKPLKLDEIVVGYFRMFRVFKTKQEITTKLYNNSKSKNIVFCRLGGEKGRYFLK